MRRVLAIAATAFVTLGLAAPAVLAAPPLPNTGRVLISTEGDITIPADQHADVVVVVNGAAEILGEVNTLVVVDGSAKLTGATLETVVAVGSEVAIGPGTIVYGEVERLNSVVHQAADADVQGGIVDLSGRFIELGAILGPALVLLWLGFGLSTILAGLLLAALAARQVRSATQVISREPLLTAAAGIVGAIGIPIVAILLLPTVIGTPLALGILLVVLPLVAFAGYLVAATWLGGWILGRLGPPQERERPYLPVILGVVVLGALGLVPLLGIVVAVVSLLGFGAVLLRGLRTISPGSRPATGNSVPVPAPMGA